MREAHVRANQFRQISYSHCCKQGSDIAVEILIGYAWFTV
jgi:hypothetical protein